MRPTACLRLLAGCVAVSWSAGALADCNSTFLPSETQASVKAKLDCLAEEVRRLQLEVNLKDKQIGDLSAARPSAVIASKAPSEAIHFGPILGISSCIASTKAWITSKNGTYNSSTEKDGYLYGNIGDQLVHVSCGLRAANTMNRIGSDIGIVIITGHDQDTTSRLRDEFGSSKATPF